MAFVVAGPNTKVLVADVDLSTYFNSISLPAEVETADTTGFGKLAHCYISTLKDGTLSLGGFWDGAVDAVDEELAAALGSTTARAVTVGLAGLALGDIAKLMSSLKTSYETSGEVAGVVEISAEAQSAGDGMESGVALHALTAETLTGNGTAVDGAASSANGGVGHLHVTAASGAVPTLAVKIQHSADNVTFADLITFTGATTRTSQRIEVTGTVNRYVRAVRTIGGSSPSFTYAVAFARR